MDREECLDFDALKVLAAADIAEIPGLVAADHQAIVHVVNTITNGNFTTWSPAIHQHFPRDERDAIVATLLELRRSGLPNDMIVGHILPATFIPPWAESEDERRERHRQRFFEERQRARALLQG